MLRTTVRHGSCDPLEAVHLEGKVSLKLQFKSRFLHEAREREKESCSERRAR